MIVGIGLDLVDISRVAALLERHGARAVNRIFTPDEAAYCSEGGGASASYAARFAAKEAFLKALGTGWSGGIGWTDVEVVRMESGAPCLRLHGEALRQAEALGVARMHLSLTHTGATAGAFVILESCEGSG